MSEKRIEELLDENEYCRLLGISNSKAKQDRVKGTGCRFLKIGRSVKYRPEDVRMFLEGQVRQNTIKKRS